MPYRNSRITRIVISVFFVLVAIYAYFEARNILFGPKITLDTDRVLNVSEQNIIISGNTKNISSISLNGRIIAVTEGGLFEEPISLAAGYNYIVLEAEDKFNRRTKKTLEIAYTPRAEPDHANDATTTSQDTAS